MYEEYYITLPGGFALPLAVCVDTYRNYEIIPAVTSPEDGEAALDSFVRDYLQRQMVAGQILLKKLRFSELDGLYRLEGECLCREMIGRQRREQIGELHGKNS